MHGAHAQFMAQAKTFNRGREINLLRSVDTRMAGFFYALHRALRLRTALEATVANQKWHALERKPIMKRAEEDIKCAKYWKSSYVLLRAVFPLLKLLRLSDSNKPGMDKMYYYINQARSSLEKSKESLNDDNLFDILGCDRTTAQDAAFSNDSEEETENEVEEEGDENEATGNDTNAGTVYEQMRKSFESRMSKLSHDYAILGWICCVHPDVRKDCNVRFEKLVHGDAVERIITKLYAHQVHADLPEIINTFWKEWRMFVEETGIYERRNMWNVRDAREGKSAEWHKMYSRGRTSVMGYLAPRATAAVTGMGASERAWATTKLIRTSRRARLGGGKIEKLTVVSSTYKLNKARIKRQELEKLTCTSRDALWGEEDESFDLALTTFGVNVGAIRNTPTVPVRLFHCWIETWEEPLLKSNRATSKIRLLQKYKGLVFKDDDETTDPPCITYTISSERMYWKPYRGGGWCVVGEPANFDGTNEEVLQDFIINETCLIPLIMAHEQAPLLNIEMVTEKPVTEAEV
jgi:hypothetical protein